MVDDPWKVHMYEDALLNASIDANLSPSSDLLLFPEMNISIREEFINDMPSTELLPSRYDTLFLTHISESLFVFSPTGTETEIDPEDISFAERLLNSEQKDFAVQTAFVSCYASSCPQEFQERIAKAPSQCIRYCFDEGVEPLLPNKQYLNLQDIPNCERCGAPRRFEFQVLPQLLHFLGPEENTYDW